MRREYFWEADSDEVLSLRKRCIQSDKDGVEPLSSKSVCTDLEKSIQLPYLPVDNARPRITRTLIFTIFFEKKTTNKTKGFSLQNYVY